MPFSVSGLLCTAACDRDLSWLCTALQSAVELELFTIPPYLTAMWSICDDNDEVADLLRTIALQEMMHAGVACNLLAGLGARPQICNLNVAPQYPRPLPGNVHPDIPSVSLARISESQVDVFMQIEKPEFGDVTWHKGRPYPTIGAFYSAVYDAYHKLNPTPDPSRQLEYTIHGFGLRKYSSASEALHAIDEVRQQGEGTASSPLYGPSAANLAHYFRFGEVINERRYKEHGGSWDYDGAPLPFPQQVFPMADIPDGGYPGISDEFDKCYTRAMQLMQEAWDSADGAILTKAVEVMQDELADKARALMRRSIPGRAESYGPSFVLKVTP